MSKELISSIPPSAHSWLQCSNSPVCCVDGTKQGAHLPTPDYLKNINSSNPRTQDIFVFIWAISIFFFSVLQFSICIYFSSLVKLSHRYCFDAMVNGIFFLLPVILLLVTNSTDFCL